MKKKWWLGFFVGMIFMTVIGIAGYMVVNNWSGINTEKVSSRVDKKLDYLQFYIDRYYLEDTKDVDLESGIYKGFVNSLGDPYSAYYTEEEYKELLESQSGEYCGIGVQVSQNLETGIITMINVFKESPAMEAGIKSGDILYKVEDEEVTGVDLDKVVTKITGDKNTIVKLTVYRESTKEYIDVDVHRRVIDVPTVEYNMIDEENQIGYIAISQFDAKTDEKMIEAIDILKKAGMKSVIFDLRNNPGGMYDTVCNMLDALLPEGILVYTLDKNGKKVEETSDAEFLDMPMTVLINGESASASEIFAGAIQDFGAGKIIGTQSFGKGIVQSLFALKDGSAIKLTVSKYYTPKGVNIHGTGITPDIEVEDDVETEEDEVIEKALEQLVTDK